MKIKFIKEYRAIGDFGAPGKAIIAHSSIGDTADNLDDEDAQWLIDNGFAEEVKESGWWEPKKGEDYYFINDRGAILYDKYEDGFFDNFRVSVGNCFKTYFAADKYRDYLKADATIRKDEGLLTPEHAAKSYTGYYVCINENSQLRTDLWAFADEVNRMPANIILFDTIEHAQDSLDNHPDEWKIIANYDWSRE